MNFGEYVDGKPQQILPKSLAPREQEIGHFMDMCHQICRKVLTILALGLGVRIPKPIPCFRNKISRAMIFDRCSPVISHIYTSSKCNGSAQIPEDWFTSRHDPRGPSGCTFRYLFYPPLKDSAMSTFRHGVDVRAGAHSDYGSVTLLFQRDGQSGLEIQTPTGDWAPVPVRPAGSATNQGIFPPILVNFGDLLSYWTCGLLKSTVHRVVFPEEEQTENWLPSPRYSMAYFCHPVNDSKLVSVPSELVERHRRETGSSGPQGNGDVPLTAREHLAERLAATYGGSKEDYH